jgi:hypothetical protein
MKEVSRREDHMHNAPAGQPLLVLDMYEHAYHSDYGAAAAKYVDTRQCGHRWERGIRFARFRTHVPRRLVEAFRYRPHGRVRNRDREVSSKTIHSPYPLSPSKGLGALTHWQV